MKAKVLVINTGGTIGMEQTDTGLAPKHDLIQNVIQDSEEFAHAALPDFELINFEQLIDSAEMNIASWNQIIKIIIKSAAVFDGFLILHGTDTMAYTAAILSFALIGLNKSVVLTGSQIPISELRNDAKRNLITALILAGNSKLKEVCIYFDNKLFRGNRCIKATTSGFEALLSPNYPPLAAVGVGITLSEDLLLKKSTSNLVQGFQIKENKIASIKLFPGFSASIFSAIINTSPKAIILEAYGAGNFPVLSQAFLDCFIAAKNSGIYIVIRTQCIEGEVSLGAYHTSSELINLGAISCSDMTFETVLAKLYYLLSMDLSKERFQQEFLNPIVGELSTT